MALNLGKTIAPARFIAFVVATVAATLVAHGHFAWSKAAMIGFDVGAGLFLILIGPMLFRNETADAMRQHARDNDANRAFLLVISTVVMLVVMITVTLELGGKSKPDTILIVATLALAWLFANTIYALHYAHVYYLEGSKGGLD